MDYQSRPLWEKDHWQPKSLFKPWLKYSCVADVDLTLDALLYFGEVGVTRPRMRIIIITIKVHMVDTFLATLQSTKFLRTKFTVICRIISVVKQEIGAFWNLRKTVYLVCYWACCMALDRLSKSDTVADHTYFLTQIAARFLLHQRSTHNFVKSCFWFKPLPFQISSFISRAKVPRNLWHGYTASDQIWLG